MNVEDKDREMKKEQVEPLHFNHIINHTSEGNRKSKPRGDKPKLDNQNCINAVEETENIIPFKMVRGAQAKVIDNFLH
jgi:hypothetical protein